MREHIFTTYIRTKILFQNRLKDLKQYDTTKIYQYELKKFGIKDELITRLKRRGEIWSDKDNNYKVLVDGPIIPDLIEFTKKKKSKRVDLTETHLWMREQLKLIELEAVDSDIPVYFKTFIKLRDTEIDSFFSVDNFSGRVHTPVVNLKHELRSKLRLDGSKLISLDVKQMQPTILAKVLNDAIGSNAFSESIFQGEDVYLSLQRLAGLTTRDEAKKCLFRLIFGKSNDDLADMFKNDGDKEGWVKWINEYKSKTEINNPHKRATHTNLAWLLQFSEVQVMTGIWDKLCEMRIPFLTIHDDILCKPKHKNIVYGVMDAELKKHFPSYNITVTE